MKRFLLIALASCALIAVSADASYAGGGQFTHSRVSQTDLDKQLRLRYQDHAWDSTHRWQGHYWDENRGLHDYRGPWSVAYPSDLFDAVIVMIWTGTVYEERFAWRDQASDRYCYVDPSDTTVCVP